MIDVQILQSANSYQKILKVEGTYMGNEVVIKDLPTHIEIREAGLDDLKTIKVVETGKGFNARVKLDITPGNYEAYYEEETLFIDKID